MGLRFESPLFLLLLFPAVLYLYWVWRSTARMDGRRRRAVAALRGAVVLLIVLALAGLQTVASIERKAVAFVADRSDSVARDDAIAAWIREAASAKTIDDTALVLSAGTAAAVERQLSEDSMTRFEFGGVIDGQYTRLDEALRLAGALLPEDASARIVLLSDGKENVGDAAVEARLLRDKGIPVDVVPLAPAQRQDAALDALRLPERLYKGERYAVEAEIASTFAGEAVLRIYEDNREIASRTVELTPGANRFALQGIALEEGLHRYRAELYAELDQLSANNAAYGFSRVEGPPRALLVEGSEGEAANVANALDASLIPYELVPPEMLPLELSDYAAYDSIVLVDVPATRLSERRMQLIEQAVRDYGVGLVMIGGEQSYGLGGYFQTPIERALPVYMDLRGKREMPSLALMLVIDKSGSMADGKLELAQEAAARTAELLRERDTIGVLAFDSAPWWVVEPQRLTDRDDVIERIGSITADGGTDIYPAVAEAFAKVKDVDAQRKHIILLTDGQSAGNEGYETMTSQMVEAGVTLSTVAIGGDADRGLLERLAELAQGRYYATNDQSTVPAIFSREAVLMSRTYIVDRPFSPVAAQAPDWQALFAGGLPEVRAYVATTPKETAEVALASPEQDPLLARWQYGAGKAVAWTSDAAGKWSPDWVNWDRFPETFAGIVKWTFPTFAAAPMEVETSIAGNEANIRVRVGEGDRSGLGSFAATVTDEAMNVRRVELEPTAPGEYAGRAELLKPGAYLARIDQIGAKGEGEPQLSEVTIAGFVVPYSPEYRIGGRDGAETLRRIAELTGGRVLNFERPSDVFAAPTEPKLRTAGLHRELLAAALLLWLADIALRRLQLPWGALLRRLAPRRSPSSAAEAPEAPRAAERLRRKLSAERAGSYEAAPAPAPSPPPAPAAQPPAPDAGTDRMSRLLEAKRRRNRT